MIDVSGLTKIFYTHQGQEHRAVNAINFHVKRGEVYGLLGPNGAGKSTTLRMLAGLMTPTSGVISIDNTFEPIDLKARVGFLTADTGLYARLTPRETLIYFAELRGVNASEAKVQADKLLDLLGIQAISNRRCEGLSTGEKQRVQIARTLVGDPPVLILDEPTRGLDVLTNRVILDFIRSASSQGRTIILSTHHLDEVELICSRFGLLHKGSFLASGTIHELRALSGRERLSDIFLGLVEAVEGGSALNARELATPDDLVANGGSTHAAS
jgi:sodium transport system ATP-binding protein